MASAIVVRGSRQIRKLIDGYAAKLKSGEASQLAFAAGEAVRAQTVLHLTGSYLKVGSQKGGKSSGRRLRESFSTRNVGRNRAVMGSPTIYAPVHEFGLNQPGQVVRSHVRIHPRTRKPVTIKQHTRNMRQRERRYLRDAIVKSEAAQVRAVSQAFTRLVGR